jgi:hypothetical protein
MPKYASAISDQSPFSRARRCCEAWSKPSFSFFEDSGGSISFFVALFLRGQGQDITVD